jgi:hypothetical protein
MKVVINGCYGGFGLSPKATKRLAELEGKECYFFVRDIMSDDDVYTPISVEDAKTSFMWYAYSVPNPEDYDLNKRDDDGLFKSANERARKISIKTSYDIDRDDPLLVQVIEELGEEANGSHAKLEVIEIPDGVEYTIDEYDGIESIHEKHRSWP